MRSLHLVSIFPGRSLLPEFFVLHCLPQGRDYNEEDFRRFDTVHCYIHAQHSHICHGVCAAVFTLFSYSKLAGEDIYLFIKKVFCRDASSTHGFGRYIFSYMDHVLHTGAIVVAR